MGDLAGAGDGQTPLDPDEAVGLIPTWVATRDDLNRAEQDNVARALLWLADRKPTSDEILSERFVRRLHQRMFADVWKWAGTYRATNKNIGIDSRLVVEEVAKLLANTTHWVEHKVFPTNELAVRFHHGVVWIHPFANGNGRHARLAADALAESLGEAPLRWGVGLAADPVELRRRYIEALQSADAGEIGPLLEFSQL